MVALPIVLLALVVLAPAGASRGRLQQSRRRRHQEAQGTENGVPLDGVAFHPYYTVHDLQAIAVFLFIFCAVIFFLPEMGGYFLEFANFEEANGLKTPEHIAPVWYFTPFLFRVACRARQVLGLSFASQLL